jgi:hypothetical protein
VQNNTFDFSLTRARGVTHDFVIRPKEVRPTIGKRLTGYGVAYTGYQVTVACVVLMNLTIFLF